MSLGQKTRRGFLFGAAATALAGATAISESAEAYSHRSGHRHHVAPWVPEAILYPEPSWIAIDPLNGQIFDSNDPDDERRPASLAKLVTIYVAFEAIKGKKLPLNQPLPVSEYAASQSEFKLPYGNTPVDVELLIKAAGAFSCNTAATELAMRIAGSEPAFAEMMTSTARDVLDMKNTVLVKASGYPAPGQVTTARDMSKPAPALYENFPEDTYRDLLDFQSFELNGRSYFRHDGIMYEDNTGQRNPVIRVAKTGQENFEDLKEVQRRGRRQRVVPVTEKERNMAIYATDGIQRVSVVVMGATNQSFRLSKTNKLIESGFRVDLCEELDRLGFELPRNSSGGCPAVAATPAPI